MPVPRNHEIEALAAHVLHHDEIVAIGGLDLVNCDDVRMVEGRRSFGFLYESTTAILVA